jgi:hypothetical protein
MNEKNRQLMQRLENMERCIGNSDEKVKNE